jgi:hypothetical protein
MNAAEWLRSVSHRSDPDELPVEAAEALAWFAEQPPTLVVACRRLLAHHPESAPLWWLCSTVLTAPDPVAAARAAGSALAGDTTPQRLEAALPVLVDDEVLVVAGWSSTVDRAVAERPDLSVVSVRLPGTDHASRLRRRTSSAPVRLVDVTEVEILVPGHALVPALAFGGTHAVVPGATSSLLDALPARVAVWLVGGVGRALPSRVLDALEARAAEARLEPGPAPECVSLERFDRVVGPRGVERTTDAARAVDCPIAPELLGRP